MTYEESAALMQNIPFRNRIKVACIKFANSIVIEDSAVPAHNTRLKWADMTFRAPDQQAMQVQPTVAMDPAVAALPLDEDGDSSITDEALQPAVELAVAKMM